MRGPSYARSVWRLQRAARLARLVHVPYFSPGGGDTEGVRLEHREPFGLEAPQQDAARNPSQCQQLPLPDPLI